MAFFTSLLLQSGALITFYTVSKYTLNPALPISTIATIFPIGFFTVALPIAPGGLGVGHVAFEELIKLSGSEGGANAFNIYTLTLMFFNLFGCIPYLKMSAGMTKEWIKMIHESTTASIYYETHGESGDWVTH